jgi:hypothetical protein
MKFKTIIALMILIIPAMAFAQVTDADTAQAKYYMHTAADQLSVGTSVTTYTDSIALTNSDHHGLYVRSYRESGLTTGTVDFDITAEYSIRSDSGFAAVTTPITFATISALGNKPIKLYGLCFMPFIKFKLVSGATNTSDVKVDMFLIRDSKQR